VWAPKILGHAIDVIYDGVLAMWRGDPGAGIDYGRLGELIMVVLAMYLVAGVFNWLQGYVLNKVVVAVVVDLRADVERKIHRLPLSYYDTRQRGDILSRTTNDVDNVQQALQQADDFRGVVGGKQLPLGLFAQMAVTGNTFAVLHAAKGFMDAEGCGQPCTAAAGAAVDVPATQGRRGAGKRLSACRPLR